MEEASNLPESTADEEANKPARGITAENRDIHRIGGASIENLRLKPKEAALDVPGISVLKAPSAGEAAEQMRAAFPHARGLLDAAKIVASTTEDLIRSVGFDIIQARSKTLPNHCRITHPDGVSGFNDDNLARLASVFVEISGL